MGVKLFYVIIFVFLYRKINGIIIKTQLLCQHSVSML